MTCIPDLHRSLAPRDPNQLLPLGLADGLYFCGTRIPPTRGVAPLSPHSAGRIGCTRVLRAPQLRARRRTALRSQPPSKVRPSNVRVIGLRAPRLRACRCIARVRRPSSMQAPSRRQAPSNVVCLECNFPSFPRDWTSAPDFPSDARPTRLQPLRGAMPLVAHPGRRPGFTALGECLGTAISATECRTQAQ